MQFLANFISLLRFWAKIDVAKSQQGNRINQKLHHIAKYLPNLANATFCQTKNLYQAKTLLTSLHKKSFSTLQFGKIGVLVNFIIQKSSFCNLLCLICESFSFMREN